MSEFLDVCAAVIRSGERCLLARRPEGAHMAGCWEFPGGKKRPGETGTACVRREIAEELGLDIEPGERLAVVVHRYPEKHVRIEFYACHAATPDRAVGLDGQEVGWFTSAQLPLADMALADRRFAKRSLVPSPATPEIS